MRKTFRFLYILLSTAVIVIIVMTFLIQYDQVPATIKNKINSVVSTVNSQIQNGIGRLEAAVDSGYAASSVPYTQTDSDLKSNWSESGIAGLKVYDYGKTLLQQDAQRSYYDRIAKAILDMDDKVTIPSSLEPPAMKQIYKYYYYDHTENFYLSNVSMNYSYTNVAGVKKYKSYTFKFSYRYDKQTVTKMRSEIAAKAARLITAISGKSGDEAKERALHDALVGAVQYDSSAFDKPKDYPESFTIYGALIKGTAVCDGYAKAMKLLLDSCGIQSIYVSGTAANSSDVSSHAWNMVLISGKWYYLDATFDDPVFYDSKGQYINKNIIDHTYFNFVQDEKHKLGTFNASDPFDDNSENYESLPSVG